jgi:hypothetical protein
MKSLRKAINAMCKDCTYDEYDKGTWRQQVAACTITICPLHEVRPINENYDNTYLTMELLDHWQIKPEDLDERARSILKDAPEG